MTMARSSCCLSRSASSLTTFCCIKCLIFAGSNLAEHVLCSLHAFQSLSNVHRCFQTIVVFITPVYPSVCLSICTSVHLFVCLTGVSVCIAFVCLSICTSVRTSVHTSVCLSVYASACLPVIDCCVCLCVCTGASNYCHRLPHNCLQCLFFFSQEAASERQQCDSYLWLHHVSGCGLHLPVYFQHLSV